MSLTIILWQYCIMEYYYQKFLKYKNKVNKNKIKQNGGGTVIIHICNNINDRMKRTPLIFNNHIQMINNQDNNFIFTIGKSINSYI